MLIEAGLFGLRQLAVGLGVRCVLDLRLFPPCGKPTAGHRDAFDRNETEARSEHSCLYCEPLGLAGLFIEVDLLNFADLVPAAVDDRFAAPAADLVGIHGDPSVVVFGRGGSRTRAPRSHTENLKFVLKVGCPLAAGVCEAKMHRGREAPMDLRDGSDEVVGSYPSGTRLEESTSASEIRPAALHTVQGAAGRTDRTRWSPIVAGAFVAVALYLLFE